AAERQGVVGALGDRASREGAESERRAVYDDGRVSDREFRAAPAGAAAAEGTPRQLDHVLTLPCSSTRFRSSGPSPSWWSSTMRRRTGGGGSCSRPRASRITRPSVLTTSCC